MTVQVSGGIIYPFCYINNKGDQRFGFALVSNFTESLILFRRNYDTPSKAGTRAKHLLTKRGEVDLYVLTPTVDPLLKTNIGRRKVHDMRNMAFSAFQHFFDLPSINPTPG